MVVERGLTTATCSQRGGREGEKNEHGGGCLDSKKLGKSIMYTTHLSLSLSLSLHTHTGCTTICPQYSTSVPRRQGNQN